jgi:hypothetical protein
MNENISYLLGRMKLRITTFNRTKVKVIRMSLRITTFRIMTFRIMTFRIMTFRIMTFRIMTFS